MFLVAGIKQAPEAGGCATGDGGDKGDRGHRGKGGHRADRVDSFKTWDQAKNVIPVTVKSFKKVFKKVFKWF